MFKTALCSALAFVLCIPNGIAGDPCDEFSDAMSCNEYEHSHDHSADGNFQSLESDNLFSDPTDVQHEDLAGHSHDGFDPGSDLIDWQGMIPAPYFDFKRVWKTLRLENPEDRQQYYRLNDIYLGSTNNPHRMIEDRMFFFGISMINSNVVGHGGFGPGIAYNIKKEKKTEQTVSSFEETKKWTPPKTPQSFDDIAQWPVGTTMLLKSQDFGSLIFMAGAFFTGADFRAMLRHGFTVKISKLERKLSISFLARGSLGGRAGVFLSPLIRANASGLIHRIYNYSFEFAHENPSQELKDAVTTLLTKHSLVPAFKLAHEPGTGVRVVSLAHDKEVELIAKASLGFPVLFRATSSYHKINAVSQKVMGHESHEIRSISYVDTAKARRIRWRRPGEPFIMHLENINEETAQAKIDWQDGLDPKIGAKVSYYYDFDHVSPKKVNKLLSQLGKHVYVGDLSVHFPPETEKGTNIVQLDVIFEQGNLYTLINFLKKDPVKFKDQARSFLNNFLTTNTTELNPFYNPEKKKFSKSSKGALKATMKDIDYIVEQLSRFKPTAHTDPKANKEKQEDINRLGNVVYTISNNPLVSVALKAFGPDIVKYYFKLLGTHYLPHHKNF